MFALCRANTIAAVPARNAKCAWTIVAPALMTFLLVRVSGVALLERGLAARRPGYAQYIREVPAFIPRPPRDFGTR